MTPRDTLHTYGWVTQLFHWAIFALFVALFVVAEIMIDMPDAPDKFKLYGLHKALGVTVLFLVFARISWRMANPTPKDLDAPKHEKALARTVHYLLYGVMLVMPISGIIMSQSGGHPISWFGLWQVPVIFPKDKEMLEAMKSLHAVVSWGILGLVAAHAGAALYHHFIRRDNTLKRMIPTPIDKQAQIAKETTS